MSVSLQDVSLADAPAVVLDEQKGPVKGQVPLPFHLSYDPAQVKPGHRYSVSARIEVNGELMFITTEKLRGATGRQRSATPEKSASTPPANSLL